MEMVEEVRESARPRDQESASAAVPPGNRDDVGEGALLVQKRGPLRPNACQSKREAAEGVLQQIVDDSGQRLLRDRLGLVLLSPRRDRRRENPAQVLLEGSHCDRVGLPCE